MSSEIVNEDLKIRKVKKKKAKKEKITWKKVKKQKELILLAIPFVIFVIIFAYIPIWGWTMAFQDYKPGREFFEQTWVGFKHFEMLFTEPRFLRVLRNTIAMSTINMTLGFVTAIGLALMLNEVKNMFFKRVVQTISYLPYFLSWVIAAGIVSQVLGTSGIINEILVGLKIIDEPVLWLSKGEWFWSIIGGTVVWKEVGWNTIIYLAAMSAINPALYEAADVDGAGRFKKMWHITLPGIRPTVIILLILSAGRLLEAGFEVQYLLGRSFTWEYAETIDIYVLNYGISLRNYSLATASGIFKSVVSVSLLYTANSLAKRFGQERII